MICQYCGVENEEGARVCVACGMELAPEETEPAAEPEETVEEVVEEEFFEEELSEEEWADVTALEEVEALEPLDDELPEEAVLDENGEYLLTDEMPELPKRKHGGVIAALVVIVLAIAAAVAAWLGVFSADVPIAYIKNNTLMISDSAKPAPYELSSTMSTGQIPLTMIARDYTRFSSDGKVLYYGENFNMENYSAELYKRDITSATAQSVKISDGVKNFETDRAGKVVGYSTEDGFYVYNGSESRQIDSGEGAVLAVSNDGKRVLYIKNEGETSVIYWCGTGKNDAPLRLDENLYSIETPWDEYGEMLYVKEDGLYRKKDGEDAVRIEENVSIGAFGDRTVWYQNDVLCYAKADESDQTKLNLYVQVKGGERYQAIADVKNTSTIALSEDGKYLYIIEETGTDAPKNMLCRYKVGKNALGERAELYADVMDYKEFGGNVVLQTEHEVGVYTSKGYELLTNDVYGFMVAEDAVYYIQNMKNSAGDLWRWRGGKSALVDEGISNVDIRSASEVVFLKNYNSKAGAGDLYYKKGMRQAVPVDTGVTGMIRVAHALD